MEVDEVISLSRLRGAVKGLRNYTYGDVRHFEVVSWKRLEEYLGKVLEEGGSK